MNIQKSIFYAIGLMSLALVSNSKAETVNAQIYKILAPTAQDDTAFVLSLIDGRVFEVAHASSATGQGIITTLQLAQSGDSEVALTLSADHKTVAAAKIGPSSNKKFKLHHQFAEVFQGSNNVDPYVPTVLENDSAFFKALYKNLAKPIRFSVASQCYRRAHNWSYEMFTLYQIKSMKAFLFFTEKHIRENHYNWWFHVAPMVYVKSADPKKPKEMVIERSYNPEGPIEVNDWATSFVENYTCPEVKTYQDYEKLQEVKDCVIRKVPMYYYQPDNVEALDKEGKVLTDFVREELIDMGSQLRHPHYIP